MIINVKHARRVRQEKEMIDGSADKSQLGKSEYWPRNPKAGKKTLYVTSYLINTIKNQRGHVSRCCWGKGISEGCCPFGILTPSL